MSVGLAWTRRELWFLSRLSDHGVIVDDGLTSVADRAHAARVGILQFHLAPIVMCRGKKTGRAMTYRDVYPTVYGEPLELET